MSDPIHVPLLVFLHPSYYISYISVFQRLYFADAQTDKIESCNLDGTNRIVILDRPSTFHPYGVSVYQDRLYWSDLLQHHIMHCNKEDGSSRVKMEGYFAYPTALHVVHPSRQLLESKL